MGLFDQILDAAGNASQLGDLAQIGSTLANSGADSSTMQTALSVVGTQVRSALQEKQANEGTGAVQALVNQFAGTSPDPQAVTSLFSGAMQDRIIDTIAQRTGLDLSQVKHMLPMLVPVVLKFLKAGGSQLGSNPILSSFLDTDGDGDVDMADLMKLASQYMK
ncbi:MAG: DUF937 domain-containing protein [Calothrix sp. MO_192.B10]|nr:DUF937 domain-containing protein [Calothrix sp. MO_192.B10]